jgi:replicative DNA helicase
VGKTSFALNVVRHMVIENIPTLFVSLEQSRIELAERLLCCHAQVDSHKLRQGHLNADDILKLSQAGDELRGAPLYIDDTASQGMLRIAANARRLMRKGLKAVFVDYLQLIDPDNRRDSRQEQVANISRRLKFLARELQIPVVALAQLNRSPEERQDHRPRLADLRESGSIEQDADTVMMLHRPEQNEPGKQEGAIDVIIAKQRNGPTGEISLAFVKQYMRFENFAVEAPFGYGGE